MKWYHCWRCQMEVPMLDEDEWAQLAPLLDSPILQIKQYKATHDCDLKTATKHAFQPALEKYFELTGFKGTNHNALFHHRLSNYGPECSRCGHLFRTPKARFCANCGFKVE